MSKYNVGAYIRLSIDESYSDSDSIDNQIKLADYYCENNDLEIIEKYIDNGYSGTTFDRPGFQNLLRDIECGLINTVIVKDLSRLGRNYLKVGYYLHYYFPDRKLRFISINDDFDSLKHDNIMERLDVPLKNMMYDHMAYETSVKVKKSLRINKENGNFVGSSVIYGYRKNPEDIHKLIIDDKAADVVREIFNMYLQGMTKSEIAEELNKREVMTPALYKKTHNLGYTKPKKDNKWNYEIIDRILRDENYTGTLVQGKRRNENYISHKEVKNPEKDWIKFENHHEELVSKEVFDKVQEMLKVQRRSTNKNDLLSGYLFCADCNGPMALVKGKKNSYYYCRNSLNKKICTKHRIRQNDLYNKIIELLNLKKLNDEIIEELNRDLITKYIDKIIVYEEEKVDVILKYERKIKEMQHMTKDTTIDIQIIEKEIENAIDEKDLYRKKILKMYEEDKIIEKACKIKGSKSSAIAKDLKEKFSLIDNPAKIYEKVLNFKNYKDSYFDSILLIRKEMIDSRNNKLFYSYLFMISHYIELVIKAVLLNKNNDLPSNHDILKIFTNDKDYLIGIGLKLDYYEYCEKQLKQIGEYAATNDFSMCFRFPFDKNYQSKIITKKMMNIKFSDIERIVNEQKYLFMIFEFMIVLSEKEFYKKVYDFSKNLLKEVDMYLEK